MKIESKYEIGDHIWFIRKEKGEICLREDWIFQIYVIDKGIAYLTKETFQEVLENDIILYEAKEKLFRTIEKMMAEIRNEEENKILGGKNEK